MTTETLHASGSPRSASSKSREAEPRPAESECHQCYLPFLIFVLLKYPEHFVMTLAIITGAHLFPYAWFYDTKAYAVAGVGITVGSLLLGLALEPRSIFWIPLFVAGAMALLAAALYASFRREASRRARRANEL